jgi:hypothetical protein
MNMNDVNRLRQLAGLLLENESEAPQIPEYRRWLESRKDESGNVILTPDERASHLHTLQSVKPILDALKLWLHNNPMLAKEDHQLINRFSVFLNLFMYPMALITVQEKRRMNLPPRN